MKRPFITKHNRRKKKKIGSLLSIGTICIVLVIAFGLLGVSYASWNQSFDITSSIHTGDISVVIRDVKFESTDSDSYEFLSFDAEQEGNMVNKVNMDIVTDKEPFNSIITFVVENNGTIPIACQGIDSDVSSTLDIEVVDAPPNIEPGDIDYIKVKITKGYIEDFKFNTFLRFVQAIG